MQKTMQTHAAVFRTGEVMREGIDKMNALWKDMANLKVSDKGMIWNRFVTRSKLWGLEISFNFSVTWLRPWSCRTA